MPHGRSLQVDIGWLVFDGDGFGLEVLVFFRGAAEEEGVGDGGLAAHDLGDDVHASQPMGFIEVSEGPPRGMVGVRVVEAGDVEALAHGVTLDLDYLHGRDLIAIVGGVSAGVAGADGADYAPAFGRGVAEKCAASLMRIGFFAVGTDGIKD